MFTEDVRFTMPPLPAWFDGRTDVLRFFAERVFAFSWRFTPVSANGQPGFGAFTSAVSDTLKPEPSSPWHATTRVAKRADAHAAIRELKCGAGRDILIFGCRTLWNDLLAAGLVDEVHFMIAPVALGSGSPAFVSQAAKRLEPLGTRTWQGSSNVLVRYRVTSASTTIQVAPGPERPRARRARIGPIRSAAHLRKCLPHVLLISRCKVFTKS